MFGALVDAESGAAESADAPQRKKLQLAPRTKPIPTDDDEEGSDAEGDEDEDEDEDDGEAEAEAAPAAMTAEAAKAKIDMDVKELWGEKDAGGSRNPDDIVEYYRSLPAEHRGLLSEKLGEDVFRIAKYRDAEVVAKGWKKAVSEDVASVDDLKAG
jgi:translation initiation factor 4G